MGTKELKPGDKVMFLGDLKEEFFWRKDDNLQVMQVYEVEAANRVNIMLKGVTYNHYTANFQKVEENHGN